ncbi:DUF2778 domain-containing protein [Erwinia sp. BNK-24-b]|uniref:DUF2778 domain-containing protein n=1 Tax=Erwinia TaxID=551 RepID=UPI001FEF8027|nr:DUF2778 domain-containing protein [Erwinia phyllosphaerae]MBV4365572.1 DUF2778 domain-containing protein [Erwinia phyllosphaerae]
MARQGKFIINDADFSPLIIYGTGTFLAYSGKDKYRNRSGCGGIPNLGPIPAGRYHIVNRPSGGWKDVIRNIGKYAWTWVTPTPIIKAEWFALYRDDNRIDDRTWINGVERGHFRWHPPGPLGVSLGCITLQHRSDFLAIRQSLLATQSVRLRNGLESYGIIEVSLNGSATCASGD